MHTVQRRKRHRRLRAKPRFWVLVLALSLSAAAFSAVQVIWELHTYSAAKREYDVLRLSAPNMLVTDTDSPAVSQDKSTAPEASPAPTVDLTEINPEYVGWLEIAGTGISYPVVQSEDNNKYLTTTFAGEANKLGAIFLDARCEDGLNGRHTIIYGHNAKDDSMFAGLSALLDTEEYPVITIVLPDNETLIYRVFSARTTDIRDAAYRWAFENTADFADFAADIGAPGNAEHIITLSTCSDTGGRDKRVLIHAALLNGVD